MRAFEGKAVLVTGGASGIGLAAGRRFRAEGAEVVLLDVREGPLVAAADAMGGRWLAGDVGDVGTWCRAVELVRSSFGRLDVAFLNAGHANASHEFLDTTDEEYRGVFSTNVDGMLFGIRALAPIMAADAGGAFVLTASKTGLAGPNGPLLLEDAAETSLATPLYGITKATVIAIARNLCGPLAAKGISINAVCPNVVDTPILPDHVREHYARLGTPLLTADHVVDDVLRVIGSGETGQVWVNPPGRASLRYIFPTLP